MDEINGLSCESFIHRFGNVVEHSPIVASAIWEKRPLSTAKELHQAVCDFLDTVQPKAILRCLPDLAGQLAQANQLSPESTKEQGSAGLLYRYLTAEEVSLITQLNTHYKDKFNFPFVLCARENKKEAIFNGLRARIPNSVDIEIENGMNEVKKISWYRILDSVI